MKKIIITFYSMIGKNPSVQCYDYPDGNPRREAGEQLTGLQTNEAPLKYFLKEHSPIDRIIALCTPEVLAPVQIMGQFESVADYVEKQIGQFCEDGGIHEPELHRVEIDALEKNMEQALAAVMHQIQSGDQILIDATGGPRDANFMNILLMQALTYKGCDVGEMVYSFRDLNDVSKNQIRKLNAVPQVMDLTSAMAEFVTYGRTRLLEKALSKREEPELKELLDSLKEFSETLELCKFGDDYDTASAEQSAVPTLDMRLERVNTALDHCERAEKMPALIVELLPTFREKMAFGGQRITLPSVVHWCAENYMLQQAATIYNENLFAFLRRSNILDIRPDEKGENGQVIKYAVQLSNEFWNLYARKCSQADLWPPLFSDLTTNIQLYQSLLPKYWHRLILPLEGEKIPVPKEAELKRVRFIERGAEALMGSLFQDSITRHTKKESARHMQDIQHQELLPMLLEPELESIHFPMDLVEWIQTEKGSFYLSLAADSCMRMRVGQEVEKLLEDYKQTKELNEGSVRGYDDRVSLSDLGMVLMESTLLRMIRNEMNHSAQIDYGKKRKKTLGQLKVAALVNELPIDDVRKRLQEAAERLDRLSRQAAAAEMFL